MTTEPQPSLQHVAIIMDGNGRWAQKRGLPRAAGHKQGADAVERVVRAAAELKIEHLTLFAFSTENWLRPQGEVSELMGLLRMYLHSKTAEMHKNNVRMKVIGDRSRLGDDILKLIDHAETLTAANTAITVHLAISYSGRWDITNAMKQIATQNIPADQITEDMVTAHLSLADVPAPDLIIRTSGEQRISNFLLWQGAYSEYFFSETFWPDFDRKDLEAALSSYQQRERRFGNLLTNAS